MLSNDNFFSFFHVTLDTMIFCCVTIRSFRQQRTLGRAASSDETATPNMASSTFVGQHTVPSRLPATPFSGRYVRHTPRRENLSCPSSGISSGISSAFSSADELAEREDQNRFVRNTDTITPLTDAYVTNAQVTDAQVTDAQVTDAPVTKASDKKDAKN